MKIFTPMPILNGRKFSKSELIIKLLDPITRNSIISQLESKKFKSIPSWIYRPTSSKTLKRANIKDFSGLCDEEVTTILFNNTKSETMRLIRSGLKLNSNVEAASTSKFESKLHQIFYNSVLIFQENLKEVPARNISAILKLEKDTLFLIFNEFTQSKKLPIKLLTKFSKDALKFFMESFSWNFHTIIDFLPLISSKFQPSVIQIWFESDFTLVDKLFQRLDLMEINIETPFNSNAFLHLQKYKVFRNALYNGIISRDFLISIKDYANRPDFEYFFLKNKINRNLG